MPVTATITRPRHPLQGRSLRVLGQMRRHGIVELLLELPDGSKSMVPVAWTDAWQGGDEGQDTTPTLGSLADLLGVCELIADLRGQAAGMSLRKEDSRAACPTQFDTRPAPAHQHRAGRDSVANTDGRAAARPRGRSGDHAAGRCDRQGRRGEGKREENR